MTTTVLSNEFMQKIAEKEAWKELSGRFNWTESLLEKYQDKVDWQEVSKNTSILWTIPMVMKFRHRINWDALSKYANEETLTASFIEAFKDKWNWTELSANIDLNLSHELLEKYADKLDWGEIIDRHHDDFFDEKGIDFYEKYKEYIPVTKLLNSRLWDEIVNQERNQLIEEITA